MNAIDLRSDTVTKPTLAMRTAMAQADVGDDVYGEDPTVRALEERVAALLGKEAALFAPSGTMANQLALGSLLAPGEEVLCERGSHIVNYEGGALAALWGAQTNMLDAPRGLLTATQVRAALRGPGHEDDVHAPRQRVLGLEDTHNRGGGAVWPLAQLDEVAAVAHQAGLFVHLDGARLWNAHIQSGVPLARRVAMADTVSVCLSKGLGTPAGSVVASTRERLPKLKRLRKRLGGGMRQAGMLAAAGLYALDHHLARLAEDHANARALAERLAEVPGLSCEVSSIETNIVLVNVKDRPAQTLVAAARTEGVLVNAVGTDRIRLVLHLDVSAKDIPEAAQRLSRAARAA
ncbi:MAG: aminotransferase class I/II-fold pyridoxal phosphate-dependent enzyme [Deltaproteobacteria bacterium]|nr:aminotransferase class I/II-fold pyridoxal phosphate-dependent enzyme [Deltaproteobacteria bacterium]